MTVTRTFGVLAAVLACAAVTAAPAAAADGHAAIVGGSEAPPGAWPSIAYLQGEYHDSEGREHVYACTGSVVAPQWIVTAAHCTFGSGDQPPERMTVTLGVTDYTDEAGERIAVDRFVPNPSYDSERDVGDAGLVHLAQPTSRPAIPIATSDAAAAGNYFSPPGVPNAAGWGAVDQDATELPTRLQQAYLQVRTPAECSSLIDGFDPGTQTCAGTPGAAGACHGDSGGPLVEIDQTTRQPALWGVTSWGPQIDADLPPCSVELPVVFTWIPAYASFIQSTVAESPATSGSAPAPAGDPAPRARTAACRKARAAATAARKRERTALRRLRAARRDRSGAATGRRLQLATRRYRAAQVHRRLTVRKAARRCRA